MAYIKNEIITPDGTSKEFTLANNFEAGTILIEYNGFIFYRYYEDVTDNKVVFDFIPPVGDIIGVSYYEQGQPFVENAIRYSTPKQIKDATRLTSLSSLTDSEVEKLIREAEIAIDSYISNYKKYYTNENNTNSIGQVLTFPRMLDDSGDENVLDYISIPTEITQATFFVVENLQLIGEPTLNSPAELVSEKLGDYSYNKRDKKYASEKEASYNAIMGTKAKLILDKYRNNTTRSGEILIRENRDNYDLLNSRQKFRLNNK